jgi:pyridoxamine 5'-phosphate oxidase-like protein
MTFQIDANERAGRGAPEPSLPEVRQRVLRFLREEAGFAQVVTVNAAGFPVGRTMGAPIADDWSVTLIQRNVHKRIGQLRRNPRLEIIWTAPPAPDSVTDRPHVYDFGLAIPRVVFLRGLAEFLDPDETLARFRRQTALHLARGQTKAPEFSDEQVRRELVGFHVRPLQVRAEGIGVGAQSFTWTIDPEASR